MKSRSSTGVGQKIDLEYNIETMRITDEGGEDGDTGSRASKPGFMETIKARATVTPSETVTSNNAWERGQPKPGVDPFDPTPKVGAEVQSNKLKQLLGKMKPIQ
jgi:hypothetical protein